MKKILLLLVLAGYQTIAQKVAINKIELNGEKIIVHYDLEDNNPNNEYQLNLYSSKDKFVTPVSKVTGDVGSEIKAGKDKKIEWNIIEEFGSYKGDIELEIRGKVFIPFIKLQSFTTKHSLTRGKAYDLTWRPGNTNPLHIEVFKGSQRAQGELNQPNNGKFTLHLGPNLKPGSGYKVKITDSKRPDDFIFTNEFKVKRKVPIVLIAIPLVGIATYLILKPSSSGEPDIPGAPELPPNN